MSAEESARFSMYLNMSKEGDYAISDRLRAAIEIAEADLKRKREWAGSSTVHAGAWTCIKSRPLHSVSKLWWG